MRSKNKTLQYSAGLCVPSAWEWTQVVRLLSQGMLQFVTTKLSMSVQGFCAIWLEILLSLILMFKVFYFDHNLFILQFFIINLEQKDFNHFLI